MQDLAIQGHQAEGRMHIEYEEKPVLLADGETTSLRKPTYTVTNWNYGPPHPELLTSPRGNLVTFWSAPERRVLSHLRWKTAAASLPERKLENFCSPATAGSSWPCTTRSHFTLHTTQPTRLRESVGTTIFHGFTISVQFELTGGA